MTFVGDVANKSDNKNDEKGGEKLFAIGHKNGFKSNKESVAAWLILYRGLSFLEVSAIVPPPTVCLRKVVDDGADHVS